MTITARAQFTKNATYNQDGKPFARQIARYYDVTGTTMLAISKQIEAMSNYLNGSVNVSAVYPEIYRDGRVTDWKEENWRVSW